MSMYVYVHVFASRNSHIPSKMAIKVDTSLSALKKVPRVKPIFFKTKYNEPKILEVICLFSFVVVVVFLFFFFWGGGGGGEEGLVLYLILRHNQA